MKTAPPNSLLPRSNGNGHKAVTARLSGYAPSLVEEIQLDRQRQLVNLLHTVKAYRRGDFSVRCEPTEGILGAIGEVLNEIIELNDQKAKDFARVARTVAQEGKMAARASIGPATGAWATSVDSV